MKPTINTSPDTWSCTTAGISPSSFVKSIVRTKKNPAQSCRRGCCVTSGYRSGPSPSRAQACQPAGMVAVVVMRVVEAQNHFAFKATTLVADVGVCLDFDQHVGVNQLGDLHHRRRRTDRPEALTVGAPHVLPAQDVRNVNPRADHLLKRGASLFQRGFDVAKRLHGLAVDIPDRDYPSVGVGRGRS